MPITKVTYAKLYPTSSFLNERVGIEIELTEGQNPKEALAEAKKLSDEFHRESNPDLYKHDKIGRALTAEQASLISDINSCDTIEQLSKLKTEVTEATMPSYMGRMKELQTKK